MLVVRRKWRVISHQLNTNPFPGSFLNYKGRMRLTAVTMQALTLVEFEGAFDTEHMVRPHGICWRPHPVTRTHCRLSRAAAWRSTPPAVCSPAVCTTIAGRAQTRWLLLRCRRGRKKGGNVLFFAICASATQDWWAGAVPCSKSSLHSAA